MGADKEAASHGETWEEHALANVACKAAIKAGQALSLAEQRELIRQLEGADARAELLSWPSDHGAYQSGRAGAAV